LNSSGFTTILLLRGCCACCACCACCLAIAAVLAARGGLFLLSTCFTNSAGFLVGGFLGSGTAFCALRCLVVGLGSGLAASAMIALLDLGDGLFLLACLAPGCLGFGGDGALGGSIGCCLRGDFGRLRTGLLEVLMTRDSSPGVCRPHWIPCLCSLGTLVIGTDRPSL